jgi:ribosomal protein S18 acetylase RimI-like enzyme
MRGAVRAKMNHQRTAGTPGAAIRRAEARDLPRIMELERLIFGDEAWPVQMVARELAARGRLYLVAEVARPPGASPPAAGTVAGYGGVSLGRRGAEVMNLAVDPAARGRGIGRALMDALLSGARAAGAKQVGLSVADGSPAAAGLYRSLGFEPVGVARGYYQPSGRDGIVMRLDVERSKG